MAIDTRTLMNAFPQEVNSGGWVLMVKPRDAAPFWTQYSIFHIDRLKGVIILKDSKTFSRSFEVDLDTIKATQISVSNMTISIILNEKDEALKEAT